MDEIRQIAIYGKGGIGKSTVACNLSLALTELGEKVFQMGCSPKVDSTSLLNKGQLVQPTILDRTRDGMVTEEVVKECIIQGSKGVLLAESGGPDPAEGCAGRGVMVALDLIKNTGILKDAGVTFVIYDVIGDVVCGGFAQPIRGGYANEIYLITSGELMSLYSANNICLAIKTLHEKKRAKVKVAGIINNMRGVEKEEELVTEFGDSIGIPVLAYIPRSKLIQKAEAQSAPVMERYPESELAHIFRSLAKKILELKGGYIPQPMGLEEIMDLLRKYKALD